MVWFWFSTAVIATGSTIYLAIKLQDLQHEATAAENLRAELKTLSDQIGALREERDSLKQAIKEIERASDRQYESLYHARHNLNAVLEDLSGRDVLDIKRRCYEAIKE